MHRIQVPQRDILQRILQRKQHRRNRQLPPIPRKHRVIDLLKEHRNRRLRRQTARDLVERKGKGNRELQDLVEENRRRGKVAVVARGRHDAGVVHYL